MERAPDTPDDEKTLLGDPDETNHPSIEEQLDERLEEEKDADDQ
jgi:hypothetical protein